MVIWGISSGGGSGRGRPATLDLKWARRIYSTLEMGKFGWLVGVLLGACASQSAVRELEPDHVITSATELTHHGAYYVSDPYPTRHNRFGFLLATHVPHEPGIDVRTKSSSGWGPWRATTLTWQEAEQTVGVANLPAASELQFRLHQNTANLLVSLRWTLSQTRQLTSVRQPMAGPYTLPNGVAARSAWGARPSLCSTVDGDKEQLALHHTATIAGSPSGYATRIRAIQSYHLDVRQWCDVGYHYLVTQDGQVWEGRPIPFQGAHVLGHNVGNIGVAMVGCFHPGVCDELGDTQPTVAMLSATRSLLAHLSTSHPAQLPPDHPAIVIFLGRARFALVTM